MSEYTDALRGFFENIDKTMQNTADPHHRAILENYLQHVTLESGPRWREIFTTRPRLITDNPVYRINTFGHFEVYEGVEAVTRHYEEMQSSILLMKDEELFVNNWGIASKAVITRFVSGAQLQREGHSVANADGTYTQSFPVGMFWPYDENAVLLGEDVYQLEPHELVEIDPAEALTLEERTAVAEPYLERYNR